MSTTSFSRTGSTLLTTDDARCYSTRTLSFPTSRSHPSTFTITDLICRTKYVNKKQVGSYTCLFSATTSQRPKILHSSVIAHQQKLRQKRGIDKKLFLTMRAVMLDEKVDLVACDFNGAAWRRTTSASPLSIIEEAFADLDPLAPDHCGVPALCRVHGLTCVGLSSTQTPTNVGVYGITVHSLFSTKAWASGRPIRAATTKYGSTWIFRSGAAVNHITKDTSDHSS